MQQVIYVLEPLFTMYDHEVKPASDESLAIFTAKATVQLVPNEVIAQLVSFYAHLAEVPCLDSLVVHHLTTPLFLNGGTIKSCG